MPPSSHTTSPAAAPAERLLPTTRPDAGTPLAIDVRGVAKTFRIPDQKIDSLKERITHPLQRVEHRTLEALKDVSFDVRRGEFFGIVGRNGSGKSTLLKILASIYAQDAGRVRTAGRVAPFIELGVGFNPELPARENITLNGVLMGLSRREARERFDAVLDFAELRDFADLKVKNYSSGMMVRLAFSIMVQADADVMLIDEVLAVGDAAFAQKCMDVFHQRRDAGKTVVLVTHDMTSVQALCDRAMLLHDGEMRFLGEPEDAAMRYLRLNFEQASGEHSAERGDDAGALGTGAVTDFNVRREQAVLRDPAGAVVDNVESGVPIAVDAVLRAQRELDHPNVVLEIRNEDHLVVGTMPMPLRETVGQGRAVRLAGSIRNDLVPGRYSLNCWVSRGRRSAGLAVQGLRLLDFVVYGTDAQGAGLVTLHHDVVATLEDGPAPAPGTGT